MIKNIAFDVDDTLMKIKWEQRNGINFPIQQSPDYDLIQILLWYWKNGHKIFVWSAGGVEYALRAVEKLGLEDKVLVIRKDKLSAIEHDIDITYDDQDVNLGKMNIRIYRGIEENLYGKIGKIFK